MDRKKRTVISLGEHQPEFDFDEAEHALPFTFPEYQRGLIVLRLLAGLLDFAVVALVYCIFIVTTVLEMPEHIAVDKRIAGIYGAGFFLLVTIYFFLFMISASQTPGMKYRGLTAVSRDGSPLDLFRACMRGFGYLVSILPVMLGFIWVVIDPEHLTWADKVSGTYIKKI